MHKDPLSRWPEPHPYDLLAEVGVTPTSSHREVLDVSFVLMERGALPPAVRAAWDELRNLERRLAIDFFLYDLQPADVDEVPDEPAVFDLAAMVAEERPIRWRVPMEIPCPPELALPGPWAKSPREPEP